MERSIHKQNRLNYRKLIAALTSEPARNESQHAGLLKLLAEKLARGVKPCISCTKTGAFAGDVLNTATAACQTRDRARPSTHPGRSCDS
jgi:hypothetical protein